MRRIATIVPLLAALCVVACGGSDDKSKSTTTTTRTTTEGPALTKTALVSKANAICRRAKTKINGIDVPADIQDADQAATYFTQVSAASDRTMANLRRLTPPASIAADWKAYVDKQQEYVNLIHTLRDKAENGDESGLQDLQKAPTLNRETNQAAAKVGATACGSDD